MNYFKHEDNDDSSVADSVNNSDNFNRADNVNRTDDRTADTDSTDSTGKIIARYMLASALVTLLMVMLSELSGSAAPVGALLLLLVVRSLFDL